jgi:hypothetical protein
MTKRLLLCAISLAAFASACAPPDVTGDWSGSWTLTNKLGNGSLTMELTQNGSAVTGRFDLGGTVCVGSGNVTGTMDNRELKGTLTNGTGGEVDFEATVSAADDELDGTFNVTGGLCAGYDGTLKLRK